MNEERQRRNLERLEAKRGLINKRMEQQLARINARFDEKEAQLGVKQTEKQEAIIKAALQLLSINGLSGITLREIAKLTHMQAPALYWYFKSKEDLVDYMAEAILEKEFKDLQPRRENETWQSWLTDHMLRLRKAMLAYPDGARVVAGAHLQPAEALARSFETALISMSSAGVDLQVARRVIMTATTYTFGYVIEEQAAPTDEQLEHADLEEFFLRYPNMKRVVTDAIRETKSVDEDYLAGLGYIIRGSTTAAS